ncbi:MAG TPA: hypothetical protein VF739_02115 [Ktedonobacterales bacterium]
MRGGGGWKRLAGKAFVMIPLATLLAGLGACAPAGATSGNGSLASGASVTPISTLAPLPPTAVPTSSTGSAVCGAWAAANGSTGQPVAAKYGAISNCELVGDSWLLATAGMSGQPGVIGVDACHGSVVCLDGQTDRGMSAWVFYPAPQAGGVRILGVSSPGVLIIDNGGHQLHFTIATGAYSS